MKRIACLSLFICLLFGFFGTARAELAIGCEALTLLPFGITGTYHNPDNGWGIKAAADLGTKYSALATSIARGVGHVSLSDEENVYFASLALTNDFFEEKNARGFFKFGAYFFYNNKGNSGAAPLAGVGWEWRSSTLHELAGTIEIGYPDVLLLGVKFYLFS